MDRRVSGGLILVMAVFVALVVPKILNPSRVEGVAAVAPPAPPPTVGDCVLEAVVGYRLTDGGELATFGPATVVPCTEPHRAEVIRVEDTPGPSTYPSDVAQPLDGLMSRCATAGEELWRTGGDLGAAHWQPMVNTTAGVFAPDRRQAAAGQRWAACALGLADGVLDRRFSDLSVEGGIPAELGSCMIAFDSSSGAEIQTACTAPHTAEAFGYRELAARSPATQDEVDRDCATLVVGATGRDGLARDPSLVVESTVYAWYASGEVGIATLPLPAGASGGWATCAVHTADDRQLTASLRRLGDAPLPWAR
ncbi:MAG: septum formation family protein [Nakamurella sp.]